MPLKFIYSERPQEFDKSPSFRSNQVGDLVNFLKAIYFYYAKTKTKILEFRKKNTNTIYVI